MAPRLRSPRSRRRRPPGRPWAGGIPSHRVPGDSLRARDSTPEGFPDRRRPTGRPHPWGPWGDTPGAPDRRSWPAGRPGDHPSWGGDPWGCPGGGRHRQAWGDPPGVSPASGGRFPDKWRIDAGWDSRDWEGVGWGVVHLYQEYFLSLLLMTYDVWFNFVVISQIFFHEFNAYY